MFGRLLRSRVAVAIASVMVGMSFAGTVAYAATTRSDTNSDIYYACVGTTGAARDQVRPGTIRLNHPPTKCPNKTDTITSWNAEGQPGPVGPPGPPGPDLASFDNLAGKPCNGAAPA